jgi:hypothetical protein
MTYVDARGRRRGERLSGDSVAGVKRCSISRRRAPLSLLISTHLSLFAAVGLAPELGVSWCPRWSPAAARLVMAVPMASQSAGSSCCR